VTILVGGLGASKAGCRKLFRQSTCGLAVPLAPLTGPSAGAGRVAHLHAAGAGWASGPWNVSVTYPPVGSMFATGSKAAFELVGPELVRRVRVDMPVPPVAIGEITPDNVGQVIETDAVRVISAAGNAGNPAAVGDFLEAIRSARSGAR